MVASHGERRMASSPRPMKRSQEEVHGHCIQREKPLDLERARRLDRGRNPLQILWDSQAPSRINSEPQEQDHGCQDDTGGKTCTLECAIDTISSLLLAELVRASHDDMPFSAGAAREVRV